MTLLSPRPIRFLFQVFVVTVFALSTEQYITLATSVLSLELDIIFLTYSTFDAFYWSKAMHLTEKMNLAGMFATFVALRFVVLVCMLSHDLFVIIGFFGLIVVKVVVFLWLFKV